jgi:hypothetical protein
LGIRQLQGRQGPTISGLDSGTQCLG